MQIKNILKNPILKLYLKYQALSAGLFFPCAAFADSTNTTEKDLLNVFDTVDKVFLATTRSWIDTGEGYAKDIFFTLAFINIVIVGINYVLYKKELQDLFNKLVITLLTLCGFLTVIQYAPTLMDTFFLKTFEMMGSKITNINRLSPTGIIDQGIDLVVKILHNTPASSLLQVFNSLTTIIAVVCIFGCFFYLGMELLVTKIHAYVVMYGCICFLGFSGLDQFRFIAISQLKSCLNVGIKLFLVYLIVALGSKSTDEIVTILSANSASSPSITGLLITTSMCLMFVTLVKRIPTMANEFLTGSMTASAADKVSALKDGASTAATLGTGGAAQKAAKVVGGAVSKSAADASAAVQTFRNGASKGGNSASKVANGLSNVAKNAGENIGQKASDMGNKIKEGHNSQKEKSIFNDRNPPKPPKFN